MFSQYTTLYKNLLLDKSIVTNLTRNYTVSNIALAKDDVNSRLVVK